MNAHECNEQTRLNDAQHKQTQFTIESFEREWLVFISEAIGNQ